MSGLPSYVTKYFWGDDLKELSWKKHKKYVTKTILNKGDKKATGWLLRQVDKLSLKRILPSLKLDKKSANFWKIYLS